MAKQSRMTLAQATELMKKGMIKGKDAEWINQQNGTSSKKAKKPKYNNQKVEYDGKVFDSKKEYNRYRELLVLLKIGEIGLLNCQESFLLIEKTETTRAMKYIADFTYIVVKTGIKVVEDVKSEITRKNPTYINKKKLMKSVHGIDIKEV